MLYSLYELNYAAIAPWRMAANFGARVWNSPLNPVSETLPGRSLSAAFDVFEASTRRYGKPDWRIEATEVNGHAVGVTPRTVLRKPFGNLVCFERDEAALEAARGSQPDPNILIVAPMSGHFATLLRGTVEAMLPAHNVYITDWLDARLVPIIEGRFDLNSFIDYLIDFIEFIGPGAATMAVCQPGPALLSAIAVMAEDDNPSLPSSMTIMGSPIDARRSPTVTNKLAMERGPEWFESNMIQTVPWPHPGALRRVYPGFIQLYSFMSMNQDRHVNAHQNYFQHLVEGDGDSAAKHREFYDEYLAVCDMTEEFYMQTIREVFQEFKLPEGTFEHHGRIVRPDAIKSVGLMTVEGERDDISGIGQTQAAHDLCTNIPASMKLDHVQPKVGHYGVFNGSRWRNEIQPCVRDFIRKHYKGDVNDGSATNIVPIRKSKAGAKA